MKQRDRFLPRMGIDTRVSPDTAMIDRFELKVGGWQADGTRTAFSTRFGDLSGWAVETATGASMNIFQDADLSPDRSRYYLTFRKSGRGPNRNKIHPLVSGQVIVELLGGGITDPNALVRCDIRMDSSWNLTRFLQAHEFQRRTLVVRPRTTGRFPLVIEPQADWWRNEMPLIPDDNMIIGKQSRYGFALSRTLEEHLTNYVGGTLGAFVQELVGHEILPTLPHQADTQDGREAASVYDPSEYRLGDIEFYWEFDHETPITFVDTITHYLPRAAKRMRVTRKHLDQIETEVSQQSQSATIYLTRNRQLKVYAKTNRRVRFEVTFPDGYRSTTQTTSTFLTLHEFVAAASNLKLEAAATLNEVLDNLWVWIDPHEVDPTPNQLRAAIVAAANDPFVATTIIYNLARHGRIALKPGDPLRDAVHRLSKPSRAVLITLPTDRNVFIVEPRYEYARRNLRMV